MNETARVTDAEKKLPIGEEEVKKARGILTKYKDGKKNLETRIIQDEEWYRLRHWEMIRGEGSSGDRAEPASAWLFNSLMNKHADAMDNYPECSVLPREDGDRRDAEVLSDIVPVIIERCNFQRTYSDNWWDKLKNGTSVYGVFWDQSQENGLGDVAIERVDLLNVYWEPGVDDIQRSRNVFVLSLVDNDILEAQYPTLKGKLGSGGATEKKYVTDDAIDTTGKSEVVDWYYKVRREDGKTVLHFAKLTGNTLLYASENDPEYAERGFYDHGKYPFVFDTLFPMKGSPCGFGYVSLCKEPQMYIDKLSQIVLENAVLSGRPRWFVSDMTGVNKDQFLDWREPLVSVTGMNALDETHMRQIQVDALPSSILEALQMKINELKETSSNRDVSQGGSTSGATAAAAIAALQEAGNKTSRDMISASYLAYTEIAYLIIELVRQFYDEARSFRIIGAGGMEFVRYSNAGIRDVPVGEDSAGNPLVRRPIFDIKIKAQKKNPFSRMSQNELAKELYGLGVFNPERAQETIGMLEMMDFEGKDKVLKDVREGQTLLNTVRQLQEQVAQLSAVMGFAAGTAGVAQPQYTTTTQPSAASRGQSMAARQTQEEKTAMTPYGQRLAQRSGPNMELEAGA